MDNITQMQDPVVAAIFFILFLVALVVTHSVSRGRVEVKFADAAIAIIPVVFWLLVSGKITKLVVGSEGITVETVREAILNASRESVASQVQVQEIFAVGPFTRISSPGFFLSRRVEALVLTIGQNPGDTLHWLPELTNAPFFRYVILRDEDESFFGILDARHLTSLIQSSSFGLKWEEVSSWIDTAAKPKLKSISGFVGGKDAVGQDVGKREALDRMEQSAVEWLPVVDAERRFAGVVERSRLVASLLLEVANQLEKE